MIPTFGVTNSMVIKRLPIDASEVTEDTELKPSDIDEFIEDAGATFAGLLQQGGLDASNLDTVTTRQAMTYVFASAVADSLDKMGLSTQPDYGRYRNKADHIFQKYASRPELLSQRVTKAKYLGDTTKTLRRDFTGRGYEF